MEETLAIVFRMTLGMCKHRERNMEILQTVTSASSNSLRSLLLWEFVTVSWIDFDCWTDLWEWYAEEWKPVMHFAVPLKSLDLYLSNNLDALIFNMLTFLIVT